jgi:hypothetical protein
MRYVVIQDCAGTRPVEFCPVRAGQQTHEVVEAYQRGLAALGRATGVRWRLVTGSVVDALVAAHAFGATHAA